MELSGKGLFFDILLLNQFTWAENSIINMPEESMLIWPQNAANCGFSILYHVMFGLWKIKKDSWLIFYFCPTHVHCSSSKSKLYLPQICVAGWGGGATSRVRVAHQELGGSISRCSSLPTELAMHSLEYECVWLLDRKNISLENSACGWIRYVV